MSKPSTPTVKDALATAALYWQAKGPSSRVMPIRARACAAAIGEGVRLTELNRTHGHTILTHLRNEGKSKGSQASYLAAFKRAVALGGGSCADWDKADPPPRRCREPLKEADLERLEAALLQDNPRRARYGWLAETRAETGLALPAREGDETAYLLEILRGTGMRVDVEALSWEAWVWNPQGRTLAITGKGGHERIIPVERPETVELLENTERLNAMRRVSYSGHLKRWNRAIRALNITTRLPTPHAVRHFYATRAYERSGRSLKVVQELLGHSDISTTARYLGVDMEDLRDAVR